MTGFSTRPEDIKGKLIAIHSVGGGGGGNALAPRYRRPWGSLSVEFVHRAPQRSRREAGDDRQRDESVDIETPYLLKKDRKFAREVLNRYLRIDDDAMIDIGMITT